MTNSPPRDFDNREHVTSRITIQPRDAQNLDWSGTLNNMAKQVRVKCDELGADMTIENIYLTYEAIAWMPPKSQEPVVVAEDPLKVGNESGAPIYADLMEHSQTA